MALLAASALLVACGEVGDENVKPALSELPYEIEYRDVELPSGAESAVAGRATNEQGAIVDFAVTFLDVPLPRKQEDYPAVRVPGGGGFSSYSDEDTSYVYTSNGHASPHDSAALEKARFDMRIDIPFAICKAVFGDETSCI